MVEERRHNGGGQWSPEPELWAWGSARPLVGTRAGSVLGSVSLSGALGPTRMGNDKTKVEGQSGPGSECPRGQMGPRVWPHVVHTLRHVRPPCAHVPPQGRGQGWPSLGPTFPCGRHTSHTHTTHTCHTHPIYCAPAYQHITDTSHTLHTHHAHIHTYHTYMQTACPLHIYTRHTRHT